MQINKLKVTVTFEVATTMDVSEAQSFIGTIVAHHASNMYYAVGKKTVCAVDVPTTTVEYIEEPNAGK